MNGDVMKPNCFGDLGKRASFLGKCLSCEYQRECVKPAKGQTPGGRAHRPR